MLLFQQIEDLAYKHTDARRTIGEFLLAKKSRVREYNMQQIALMSQAPNLYVGELFRRKMATIGKNVLITESDLGLLAHSLHKEDCAILISYSGNSERRLPLKVIPILEEAGVPIIAITGMGDNLLRQHATCVLSMSSRERLYTRISNFATEESINFILNMLYACYFSKDYEKNLDFKTKASRILEFQRFSENSDIQEKPQT